MEASVHHTSPPRCRLLNDIFWAVAQVFAVGAVLLLGYRSAAVLLLAWGVAGTAVVLRRAARSLLARSHPSTAVARV